MNKLVLGLSLAGSLILSACSGDQKAPIIPGGTAGSGGGGSTTLLSPIFAPGSGELPVPNDLLFNGTTDLTLNFPVVDPTDFSDPKVAMSGLDGWSAVAPFAISFRDPSATAGTSTSLDLDPATVIPGVTVRMFKVNVLRADVQPGIPAPTGPVTSVASELQPGVDFVATYSAPLTVAMLPLKPLQPQASYMVVLTNGIHDTSGNALIADGQYAIAKTGSPLSGVTAALEPVRQLVNAMEGAAVAFDSSLNKADIVLSYQFTVQSVGTTIENTKAFYIDLPFAMNPAYKPASSFSSLMTDTTPFTTLGAADLYKGQFTLSYFLTAPSATDPVAPVTKFWTAASMVPDGSGGLVPNPAAGGNLTYANSLPQTTGQETVPLLVSMPKASLGCTKPTAGYPVMIFQHGITSDRTAMLGIADTMGAPPLCTAVVSMDMPLHGIEVNNPVNQGLMAASGGLISLFEGYAAGGVHERTFGIDFVDNATGAPGPDGNVDSSGADFINLSNLLVSRDNVREAIVDLLSLEKGVPFMDIDGDGNPDFDSAKISFMGHSLGGIVGSSFIAYSDNVKVAVLANPGGGIAKLLDASLAFGPVIRAGLTAKGIDVNGPDYQAFLFATQTVIDSGDPINTALTAVGQDIPTLMLQVKDDAVVPNSVATAPLSGTMPLAANLNLVPLLATSNNETVLGNRIFSRLNLGTHSSVLSPASAPSATMEMQQEIATFIGSGGVAVTVGDPSLLDQPAP